jgi:hypothetical protein
MSRVREIVLITAGTGSKHTLKEEHATLIDAIAVVLSDILPTRTLSEARSIRTLAQKSVLQCKNDRRNTISTMFKPEGSGAFARLTMVSGDRTNE